MEGRVLAFRGELDLAGVGAATEAIGFAVRDGGKVLLDLQGLTFIDASGLRVLLAAQEVLGDRLTLSRGRGIVARVFELTGLDAKLPFATAARRPAGGASRVSPRASARG